MTPVTTAHYSNDSESLQADVMRFMAIIAFCLIAILALVRNVEPVEPTEAPVQTEVQMITTPEPAVEPEIEPVADPKPLFEQIAEETIEPIPEPALDEPERLEPLPTPEPVMARVLEPEPVPELAPAPRQESVRQEAGGEEAGLTLRFASDGDFLRLISKGDIKVYAFLDTDVLGLNGSYRFMDSPSPGQVYELLNASIPSLIVDALKRERSDIRGYRWGIALPNRISTQIELFLKNVEQGQLVIDRYGDVHHVAAS